MSTNTLVATTGRRTGSAESRRLRREDKIPGVLYGHGMTPVSIVVDRRELRNALNGSLVNTLVNLDVDGTVYPAILKDMQRHPVRRTVSHVDFMQVNLNEVLTLSIVVRIEGEAKAVVSEGGLVDPAVNTIEITAKASDIPSEIVIDITDMKPGDVIRLGDLTLPVGATATGDPEEAIVIALSTAGSRAEGASEAGEAEGEGETAAEGDAGE
jgi:large subunit ribosomal protein L25